LTDSKENSVLKPCSNYQLTDYKSTMPQHLCGANPQIRKNAPKLTHSQP
jgi:hypothetical protein